MEDSNLLPEAIATIQQAYTQLRNCIVSLTNAPHALHEELWEQNTKNGHITSKISTMQGHHLFEQVGLGFSQIHGTNLPAAAITQHPELKDRAFAAVGVSLIIHPDSPFIPTTHLNVRVFTTPATETQAACWWIGGGFDLTPYYPFVEDCRLWHETARDLCQPFGEDIYPSFKQWCDKYFYLPHRQEARGIGGIFFDSWTRWPFPTALAFLEAVVTGFITAYSTIVQRRQHLSYTELEKDFQTYRRGRYVEFNLLYDRGTLFGLQSQGRTESILMSLPPKVQWKYNWQPIPNSREAALYTDFLPARDWLAS
jgi:coproporphyrinogen III oxidase